MHKKIAIFFLFFTLSILVKSQSTAQKDSASTFRLTEIEVCSGKGAITSGVYTYFNLENKKGLCQITLSQEDLEITYFYRLFKGKLFAGPNLGYFYNIPYLGPEVLFSPSKYLSTFHWIGWSLGRPEEKIDPKNSSFLFAVNSISLNFWRFKGTYCLINYLKFAPQHTVSLKYTQPLNNKFTVYTDVGYDFLNKNQLLKIGLNWKQ